MRHEWIWWIPTAGYLLTRYSLPPSGLRLACDLAVGSFVVVRILYLLRYKRK